VAPQPSQQPAQADQMMELLLFLSGAEMLRLAKKAEKRRPPGY
jgi:hypothetical protein